MACPTSILSRVPTKKSTKEVQRPPLGSAHYPDSSVDLTCATVDTQKVKFAGSAHACFGPGLRVLGHL